MRTSLMLMEKSKAFTRTRSPSVVVKQHVASRKALFWRLSNTMDSHFCVEALEDAIERHGIPEVFNTDQGGQFTSQEFIDRLKREDIQISMDGKGRWLYNVFIERLWRSVNPSVA